MCDRVRPLAEEIARRVGAVSGWYVDRPLAPDAVIGGDGVPMSLADFLNLVEWLITEHGVDRARLLEIRPPYTVDALARAVTPDA